jgi:hypothetical protein
MSLKKSFEEVENLNLTNQEVQNIHKIYKKKIDKSDTDSDSDSDSNILNDSDSSSESNHNKFIFKKGKRTKETTMLYMFKKYESLQTECNQHKNKLYKMKIRAHSEEQKQHYKNLEFSNLLLEKNQLQQELQVYKYTSIKYYISITLNILLGVGLSVSYFILHNI